MAGVLLLVVAASLAGRPHHQVIRETVLEDGIIVRDTEWVEANLWYRWLPPQRYLKITRALGMNPGTEPAYPGRRIEWVYPVFHHPDPVMEAELNRLVMELLHHPRGIDGGIDYQAIVTWKQREDQSIELTYRRSYYPFFAIRPLEDKGSIKIK